MTLRVLVPLDGSQRSLDAMEKAMRMLAPCHPDVLLFTVQHEGFANVGDDRVEEFDADEDDEIFPTRESAQRMLDQAAVRCRHVGVEAKTKVTEGRYIPAILEQAAQHDLVVMHALGRSNLKEKLRMSGTETLARKLETSVLLVADDPQA